MYILTVPQVQKSLENIDLWFTRLELFIAQYESFAAFFLLMFLFVFKSFVPIIPFSVLFIASGMVFDAPIAFLINVLGFLLLCLVKFYWGKEKGGGKVHKLANRSYRIYKFMGFGGKGNKWMLSFMRFVPLFPVNTVSRAYGATQMKTGRYLFYSLVGFLPRLVLWSVIGFNIFDPFTIQFMAPIIILLVISGISLLILNDIMERKDVQNAKK
jgi:uncharacterized membrane protein YdjX (TVP38/TMEM64 family)